MATVTKRNLSQLEGQKRIDAEYYQPEYTIIRHKLNEIETRRIKELSASVVSFGAYSLCNYIQWRAEGIPYLNVENIKDGYIDFEEVKYIDENVNEILKKSQVREGQVILTMAGTIGNAAVAYKLPGRVNSNQATVKITLKPNVSPFFLAAFLNSYFGRKQTEWEIVTSVQPNIFLWQIENIRVPVVSKELEREIETIYREGLDKLNSSKSLYSQAENLLLEELGLKDFQPKYELSYSASLFKAFGFHRVDAEYFQPHYDRVVEHVIKTGKYAKLKNILNKPVQKGVTPQYDLNGDIIVVNSQHLGRYCLNIESTDRTTQAFWQQNKRAQIKPKDIMIYATGAYIGRTNIWPVDYKAMAGVDVLLVRPSEAYNPYCLSVYLNSPLGILQAEKFASGSGQRHIYPDDISHFVIYLPSKESQQRIADLVIQSWEARQKARQLLEEAKREVENLIEGKA